MSNWSAQRAIGEAFVFVVTGIATGAIVNALGQALETTPGVPFWPIFVVFFLIYPVLGFFSDVDEMVIRGFLFTMAVFFISLYLQDLWEGVAAMIALVLGIMFALWRINARL